MDLSVLEQAPAHLLPSERLLLYALTYSLRPRVYAEIGVLHGGSALIVCAAMDAIGHGKIVQIDPQPRMSSETKARIAHRATLVVGASPQALSEARRLAGNAFEMVLIDGDHTVEGVTRDIDGLLAHLAPGAYLLFHDAHYYEVHEAIENAIARHGLVDCGLLSTDRSPDSEVFEGRTAHWGGIRVLRYAPGTRRVERRPAFEFSRLWKKRQAHVPVSGTGAL